MLISNKNIAKYLNLYAEAESSFVDQLNIKQQYHAALIIPAYDETAEFLERLPPAIKQKYLVILVINCPLEILSEEKLAEDMQAKINRASSNNHNLFATINAHFTLCTKVKNLYYFSQSPSSKKDAYDLIVVDRFNSALKIDPEKGVGQARKIAADIACALIQQQKIRSSWIYSTDADVILPNNYLAYLDCFETLQKKPSAVIFPFQHCNSKRQSPPLSTLLYELSLDYYVQALAWAGSPYAYHTLGSCLAVCYKSYVAVRGFPQRSAGEDFYILNKLNKVSPVVSLNATDVEPIKIYARHSQRVPFGTGPAVIKIDNLENPSDEYMYYHPDIFKYLKVFLECLNNIALDTAKQTIQAAIMKNCQSQRLNPIFLNSALDENQFFNNLNKLQSNSTNVEQFRKQLDHWFDAFKTLKFLHAIERFVCNDDNTPPYKKINLAQLISSNTAVTLNFIRVNKHKIKMALGRSNEAAEYPES